MRGGAPHLGEHNAEVLRDWLAMSDDEIAQLQGVLVQKLPEGMPGGA